MSDYVKYDPDLLTIDRQVLTSSKLGEFVLNQSQLDYTGDDVTAPVSFATVAINAGYTPNDAGTLLLDLDSASVSLSSWDSPAELLYPLDRVVISYNGEELFTGNVESTTIAEEVDGDARRYGASRRVTFTAVLAGRYASALGYVVGWQALPEESAFTRIRRWMTLSTGVTPDTVTMPAVDSPGSASMFDLLRELSALIGYPVRLTGPRSAALVNSWSMPFTWDQSEAAEIYASTTRQVVAGLTTVRLEDAALSVNVTAAFKANDVRIIDSEWTIPDPLPVYGLEPARVRRIGYTFTPDDFYATAEMHVPVAPDSVRRP